MTINWRLQAGFSQSIFDDLRDISNPVSESEKVNIICPNCQYHTAWKRAEDWIVCGWCVGYVGNGADKRKAESARFDTPQPEGVRIPDSARQLTK